MSTPSSGNELESEARDLTIPNRRRAAPHWLHPKRQGRVVMPLGLRLLTLGSDSRQQFVSPMRRIGGDAGENICEPSLRVSARSGW